MTIFFIRDWPEIWKLEISLSEFCPISRDWGELEIPNLARMFLMKCYWMLQNARVTASNLSELLSENQQGGGLPPLNIRVKINLFLCPLEPGNRMYSDSHSAYCWFLSIAQCKSTKSWPPAATTNYWCCAHIHETLPLS